MDSPITRAEHNEFAKRMEEEHHRQNRRIGELEKACEENNKLLVSVERLALSMENMQKEQQATVIVQDEHQNTIGLVTLEDIVEEILGSINDEYDDEINISQLSDKEYLIIGSTPIQEINRELGTSFDENNPNYDTIAGLIMSELNCVPKGKEIIIFNDIRLIVEKVEQHRITKVRLQFK